VGHLLASLAICPEHDPTNRMLVAAYWGLGRLEEALPLYARIAKLAPADAVVFGGWATTLIELAQSSDEDVAASRYAEARRHLDQALTLDPYYTGAWLTRGLLRRDTSGDAAGAAADLRTVLRLEPSHPERDAIAAEAARLEALSGG
jgi:tetratricopeptide (TPR) repeat protein